MTVPNAWPEANQRYLAAALAAVRTALQRHITRTQGGDPTSLPDPPSPIWSVPASSPAIELLCANFRLSRFERAVLLLCAGVELDASFAADVAAAQGDPARLNPTFGLALAALPTAHWSALTSSSPLRHWRLIEIGAGPALTQSLLRIDERVLHYLAGAPHTDERLAGLLEPVPPAADLVSSHDAIAAHVCAAWSRPDWHGAPPVIQLAGDEAGGKRMIAAAASATLGLKLNRLSVELLPASPAEVELLARLWEREAALSGSALLLDCESAEGADAARQALINRFVDRAAVAIFVATRERRHGLQRPVLTYEVHKPTQPEQRAVWHAVLGPSAAQLNGQVDQLLGQFNLGAQAIRDASIEASGVLAGDTGADMGQAVWDACRLQARPRLDDLAQRIEATAGWDDLVLPEAQRQVLRDVVAHVRQRTTVYETWGFASKGARGLGISALFAGASGTGKTMAAEVVANTLRLDLYRIDLSAVVSKYIGETEKNLRRIFDTAEEGGAVLLFDEADALFGKRSEVKDSHDRHANIEVSYLLQRMESYRGLAILTTNMKSALDTAFLRRIRFIVQFPFPDPAQRAEIWRRAFPRATPTAQLDAEKLGRLNVAGGNIRNIALNAAFLAADSGEPVRMEHLLRAARSEYAKLEKSLTETEIAGWV